ncbi:MAG: shikimate kinase [Marinilabiliales bacterium]|nr:MAG: shikimate kinase [Marinilabiliales bacterium]
MNRIYLIGFMGVGKSTIGKKLANKLNYNFVDIDELFENKYKVSINAFFEKYGEKLFRELENKLLYDTFSYEKTIISTGGGTPCYRDAIDDINSYGTSIYLRMPTEALINRLENAIRPRPLIKGKSHDEIKSDVEKLLAEREQYYNKANIIFDAISPDVDKLLLTVESHMDKI